MEKNEKIKKIIFTIVLIIIALCSILAISPLVSSPEFHSETIQILDAKKMNVVGWTTGTVGAATALAAVPGDATTPLANQILQLSSYFIIVIGAIFLEKILLTLTGYLAFTFLIPISCILFVLYQYINKNILKVLAIKLCIFGLVIFLVVPISVKVSSIIENTYQVSINQSIEDINDIENIDENASQKSEEKNGWDAFTSKVQDTMSNIGNTASNAIKKGEKMVSSLIDTIAVFIITSCIIPIVILLTFIWIIKIIFNITIPKDNVRNSIKNTKIFKINKKQQ